jgi:DNA invertase Pin-like site-specific DNA recombinase
MESAIVLARVASVPQSGQSFSIERQLQIARDYATSHGFKVLKQIVSAGKTPGERGPLAQLESYLRSHPQVRIIVVTSLRILGNIADFVALEKLINELDLEVHVVSERQTLRKGARAGDSLVQEIFSILNRNYIENTGEEIVKGQKAKAERGGFPGRPRFGYRFDPKLNPIVEEPAEAWIVKYLYSNSRYGSGEINLRKLRRELYLVTRRFMLIKTLLKILSFPLYRGQFGWCGRKYNRNHQGIVDAGTYDRVQRRLVGGEGGKRRPEGVDDN